MFADIDASSIVSLIGKPVWVFTEARKFNRMVVFIRHLMYATPFIKEVSKRYRLKPYLFRRALLKDGFLHALPM